MKCTIVFEIVPAVGVLVGYQKDEGIIIMIPFIALTFKASRKRTFNYRRTNKVIDKF